MRLRFAPFALLALCSTILAQHAYRVEITDAAAVDYGRTKFIDLGIQPQTSTSQSATTPAQMPGWPKLLPLGNYFTPWRSGTIEDLDHDGVQEIIVSNSDGKLYVFKADGTNFPGFPITLIGQGQYQPSVGDLDGDGKLEICFFTRGLSNGGRFYVVEENGAIRPGFPISVNNNNLEGSPTLADLDDDGELEIIVPERNYPTGRLHVFRADGTEWGGNWPVTLSNVPTGSAAVADLDHDGQLDVVYESYDNLYALHRDGTLFAGFPVATVNCNFSYQSPALADLDGDGQLEIVVGHHGNSPNVCAFKNDGTVMPGWPKNVGTWTYVPPVAIDLENDGSLEIISGRDGGVSGPSAMVYAWSANGVAKPGFPFFSTTPPSGGGGCGSLSVVDLDGDGVKEIFADHNEQDANGFGRVYGISATGQSLANFPILVSGFTYMGTPTFADVDGDGTTEMLVTSYTQTNVVVNLFAMGTPWKAAQMPWAAYHQDVQRGGQLGGGRHLFMQGPFDIGTSPTVRITGNPGESASVAMSLSSGNFHLPAGWWHLGQLRQRVIKGVTIGASGEVSAPYPIPNNIALLGLTMYFQGVLIQGASGRTTNMLERVVH